MLKKLKLLGLLFPLLAILGVSVYVSLQNQDIRNRAGNTAEFIQLTQARLLKHNTAIARIVVNNLHDHLFYRLVVSVTYTPNPEHPPPEGKNPPPEKKRTLRIKDNKTYPFLYRLDSCYFIPHISVKLYSRESGKKYGEIPLNGMVTTTELTPPCKTSKQTVTTQTEQSSSDSGSVQQTKEIETTNGEIPDDAGEDNTEPQAVDIDSIEEFSALEKESNEASKEVQTTQNAITATSGSFTYTEGQVTYDCSNPQSVSRHLHVSLVPKGSTAKLKVTSYVDVYTPKIAERTIFENTVKDDDTITVTMNQTPPSGFGNVVFASTLYFADATFFPLTGGANVGWPYNCSNQPTSQPSSSQPLSTNPTPTPTPTTVQFAKVTLPTATVVIKPSPTSQPSIPSITSIPSIASIPSLAPNTSLPTVSPTSPPSQSFSSLLSPTSIPSISAQQTSLNSSLPTPTTKVVSNFLASPTPQIPSLIEPSPTVGQSTGGSQQVSFGSLTTSQPIVTSQQTTQSTILKTTPSPTTKTLALNPTSTPITNAPFADFAGRAKAEGNETPTPFPIFHPATTPTPTTQFGQISNLGNRVEEKNPLVPEANSTSSQFSWWQWLLHIFQAIIQFFVTIFQALVRSIQSLL